jgi:3-methyladenine DNA glycosylase/8-oxoguanine DNA glycosylase/superfamily II DNA or RNA helicase
MDEGYSPSNSDMEDDDTDREDGDGFNSAQLQAPSATPSPDKKPPKRITKKSPADKKTRETNANASVLVRNPRSIAVRGLPRGALGKCLASGLTIRTLDGIPPAKGNTGWLPGRLVVVSAPLHLELELVGKTFDSGAKLQEAMEKAAASSQQIICPLANYNMEPVADPAFTSWEYAKARLESAGLVSEDATMDPIVVPIQWDGNAIVTASVIDYSDYAKESNNTAALQWAIIENSEGRDIPPILLGAPSALLNNINDIQEDQDKSELDPDIVMDDSPSSLGKYLLPPPSKMLTSIHLPASLLEKAIRRGAGSRRGVCTIAPLLDASTALLLRTPHQPGSTLAFLKTVWGCMLVDGSPFDDSQDCLGIPGLLLLSLVAKACPKWILPPSLRRLAVTAAMRTARSGARQWVGFVRPDNDWWHLEDLPDETNLVEHPLDSLRAVSFRNILRATQIAVGGRVAWGKWSSFAGDASDGAVVAYLNEEWDGSVLPPPPIPDDSENIIALWEEGKQSCNTTTDPRLQKLDNECQWSSVDPSVMPKTLVLLQAVLKQPPTDWKKHSLPALAKHVRKLISSVNPRDQESFQLSRIAAWGQKKTLAQEADAPGMVHITSEAPDTIDTCKTFREVVTKTGELSEKETEVVDCYEAIQRSHFENFQGFTTEHTAPTATQVFSSSSPLRVQVKKTLSSFEGRVAFLLAFASAVEVQVSVDGGATKETVSAMFCGDKDEPLLVQRIGKARKEGNELAGESTSGATAVPSLGYVQRARSKEEARIMEAAELEMEKYWRDGRTMPLPLPPVGMQWEIGTSKDPGSSSNWQEVEKAVRRTADFVEVEHGKKSWRFTIAGKEVLPFDARSVISSCALDLHDPSIQPLPIKEKSELAPLLHIAFYLREGVNDAYAEGDTVLGSLSGLHSIACTYRDSMDERPSEGLIYDWLPLAHSSPVPSRTWRDVLLAIRTRDDDHVVLGKGIRPDGTGTPRDMTEGVVLRLLHALEALYPTVLKKEGPFKFLVRPRGAAFYHLLIALEMLGRGQVPGDPSRNAKQQKPVTTGQKRQASVEPICTSQQAVQTTKRPKCGASTGDSAAVTPEGKLSRPRRAAATAAMERTALVFNAKNTNINDGYTVAEVKPTSDHKILVAEKGGETLSLPIPTVMTKLWPHQEASVDKVVHGVKDGKRGHADASAVGAGKTLTALATVVRLAVWIESMGHTRHGVLVMLPTKTLIKEWLLEIATHTKGFHVIEQREDGTLFSMTYAKTNPPIDGNSLIISTLDRVCRHPFARQSAWDFVVIDECLSVQNAAAKRAPSAWRQIEVSTCGVLMLSATFFRSKYESLFYMIRMLRSPLPRTMEWLPATIHEHIVCQIPETDRSWKMESEMVPLPKTSFDKYRNMIDAYGRLRLNSRGEREDGRAFWTKLEVFLRKHFEGREEGGGYSSTSVMAEAFIKVSRRLLRAKRRPLIFADTENEAYHLEDRLQKAGINARMWQAIASERIASSSKQSNHAASGSDRIGVIVAVKTIEGQGVNMQAHADCIVCRPTLGDHLEQMKGRIDRPGQKEKNLLLVVVVAEHTIEETKFANIRLAGNFFRQYIAPVAKKYREHVDLEAALVARSTTRLQRGMVTKTWLQKVERDGNSGAFAIVEEATRVPNGNDDDDSMVDERPAAVTGHDDEDEGVVADKPLNKVLRNKGDPMAVKQAKRNAKLGGSSRAVHDWLFPPKVAKPSIKKAGVKKEIRIKPLPKVSSLRFSDATPPLVLNRKTVQEGVAHLMEADPKLRAILVRVGVEALVKDIGEPNEDLSDACFFDKLLRSITFTMVSVDAGNSFLRRLAIKIGVCWEHKFKNTGSWDETKKSAFEPFLQGKCREVTFTHKLLRPLIDECSGETNRGKPSGRPHLSGKTVKCGKNDDHGVFLKKAREHANGCGEEVSAGFSMDKAGFIISLVERFESGLLSGKSIAKASDRKAAEMLMEIPGIGDWCASGVMMNFLNRADIMQYGDLTVRNYLNELYDINHNDSSETLVESAADFGDTAQNRNLIDALAKERNWGPYRSIVTMVMYHLQEENLILV